MNAKNRFSKPVAFNKTNSEDQLIIEHVKDLNFSGYVKGLILGDLKKQAAKTDPEVDIGIIKNKENGVTKITIV